MSAQASGPELARKSVDQLREFYQTDLLGDLRSLETSRKEIVQRLLLVGGGTLLVTAAVLGIAISAKWPPFVALIPLVLGLIAGGFWVHGLYKTYLRTFKRRIIKPIVEFVHPGLRYSPEGMVSQSTFRHAGIFQHSIDRYRGDDLVRGEVGGTEIEFSEIHAEYKTETRDSKGNRQTHWHTIFKGLFFGADFHKEFRGRTFVLSDVAEKGLGWIGQKLQEWNFSRDEVVKMEDADFEKEFVVYSNDQVEARYILSPSMMRRLLDFRRSTKKEVQFSFVSSWVFVAIPFREDLFEPRLFRTVIAFEPIQKYFEVLALAIGLVEDLNLNTRIWTKT